jgi:hypothetical protein
MLARRHRASAGLSKLNSVSRLVSRRHRGRRCSRRVG